MNAMLERAWQRIDNAQFGSCAACGEQIPFGRLLAMPESTHCAKCTR
jgi:RNA polymerase-binding transcription factor DksA